MAYPVAALSNLAVKLGDLALQEANYIDGVGEKLTRLRTELIWMKCFLKDAAATRGSRKEVVGAWVAEVRELAYEAEDIIDTFDIKAPSKRRGSILKEDRWLHKMGKKMDALTERISIVTRRAQTYGIQPAADDGESSARRMPRQETFPNEIEEDVVGFDDYTNTLVSVLQGNKKQVVVIAGMGGLGKTTLAKKVYHHREIGGHFEQFAWVYISQQYRPRNVWQQTLLYLESPAEERRSATRTRLGGENTERNEILNLTDQELQKRIHQKLRENKCLVILDDMWRNEDWNSLKAAFPMDQRSNLSKILITARYEKVAEGPNRFLLKPAFLNKDQSWELLRKIVFPSSRRGGAGRTSETESLERTLAQGDRTIEIEDLKKTLEKEGAEITDKAEGPKKTLEIEGAADRITKTEDHNRIVEKESAKKTTKAEDSRTTWGKNGADRTCTEIDDPVSTSAQEGAEITKEMDDLNIALIENKGLTGETTKRWVERGWPSRGRSEASEPKLHVLQERTTKTKEDPKKTLAKQGEDRTTETEGLKKTLEKEGAAERTTKTEDHNMTMGKESPERTTKAEDSKRTLGKNGAAGRTTEVEDSKRKLAYEMVEHCGGLPLAIRVLGGLLTASSTDWSTILTNIKSLIARGGNQGEENMGVTNILATSYEDLSAQLKSCFIYMAHFPENYDISVDKLEKMWIAEGMVEPVQIHWEERHEELEDLAKSYLNQLIQRSMILVGNKGPNNELETCHLHDFVRDLCLSKAKEENMLQILNKTVTDDKSGAHSMAKIGNVRRLAIHELDLLYPNPYLRSLWFFCDIFPRKELEAKLHGFFPSLAWARKAFFYSRQFWVFVTNKYKLLRVLDLEGVSLRVLPSEIGELIYLKMLTVGGIKVKKLPSSLGKLWCLQTLDLEKASILRLANVVWKLEQLRHLHLPRACHVWKFNIGRWRNLRTLRNFRFRQGCEAKRLGELAQLRELGVIIDRNDLTQDLLEAFSRALVNLRNLRSLSMNIIYKPGNESSVMSKLPVDIEPILAAFVKGCPNVYKLELSAENYCINFSENALVFPATITHLALSYCWSDDSLISKLGKFPNLRFLTLSILRGHVGWRIQGFHKLVFLALRGLRSLEEFIIDKGAMPRLEHMEISYCGRLKGAPEGLRFIESLQELKIMGMPKAFNDRLDPKGKGADYEEVKDIPSVLLIDPFEEPAELDP